MAENIFHALGVIEDFDRRAKKLKSLEYLWSFLFTILALGLGFCIWEYTQYPQGMVEPDNFPSVVLAFFGGTVGLSFVFLQLKKNAHDLVGYLRAISNLADEVRYLAHNDEDLSDLERKIVLNRLNRIQD